MTLQQLEYVVAVDTCRHFAKAAEACFVSQPTLSMMIQKLEEELGVKLFDRRRQPVVPTEIGEAVIGHARKVLQEMHRIPEVVAGLRSTVSGVLRLGIIPTLAPYLIPLFLESFLKRHTEVKLIITEMITPQIAEQLKQDKLDAGLLVTPLLDPAITERPLFYERLWVYTSASEKAYRKKYVLASDIDPDHLWLLEEGHCLRSQIMNLCELKRSSRLERQLDYEAGGLETLMRMVENNNGLTVIPELATLKLTRAQKKRLRPFKEPEPVREVSLVTHRDFVKSRLIEALKDSITTHLPLSLLDHRRVRTISIQ